MYRSVDGGEPWEHLSTLNTGRAITARFASIPGSEPRLRLGSNRGFYVSDDVGKTFLDVVRAPGKSLTAKIMLSGSIRTIRTT